MPLIFYTKKSFSLVSEQEKNILLEKYWKIEQRQIETSVVLADKRFISAANSEII